MAEKTFDRNLSRRERQIMNIVYRHGSVTVALVRAELPRAPSYSAVRAMLRVLEEKRHLKHIQQGPRYVFSATLPRGRARRSALSHLVETFFDGSAEEVVATLLDVSGDSLSEGELNSISALIEKAKEEGND